MVTPAQVADAALRHSEAMRGKAGTVADQLDAMRQVLEEYETAKLLSPIVWDAPGREWKL